MLTYMLTHLESNQSIGVLEGGYVNLERRIWVYNCTKGQVPVCVVELTCPPGIVTQRLASTGKPNTPREQKYASIEPMEKGPMSPCCSTIPIVER